MKLVQLYTVRMLAPKKHPAFNNVITRFIWFLLHFKTSLRLLFLISLLFSFMLMAQNSFAQCSTIVYVDADATGANNGTSWADAYPNLQDALQLIRDNSNTSYTEIWVAAGVYFPDEGGGKTDNDRNANFSMIEGIGIYGGFAGGEISRSDRNWGSNITVLSGDIDKNDGVDIDGGITNNTGNATRIIHNSNNQLTNAAKLDGFTITAMYAEDRSNGGAMYNFNVSPTVANCKFIGNYQSKIGGPDSDDGGGAVYNRGSSPIFYNCEFKGNVAIMGAGAVNRGGAPQYINCTFSGNKPTFNNGGNLGNISNTTTIVKNCIFWNSLGNNIIFLNTGGSVTVENSIVEGGYTSGTNIINQDPLFTTAVNTTPLSSNKPTANGDLTLQTSSPAINAGVNADNSTSKDLAGNDRVINTTIDLGAYEYGATPSLKKQSLALDGNDDYISITPTDSNTLPGSSTPQWTIEFWAKRTSTDTRDYIIGQAGSRQDNRQLIIGFNTGTNFTFDFWGNRIDYDYSTEDNGWHHWACVFDNSLPGGQTNRWLYRDGQLVNSDESVNYTGSGEIRIGESEEFTDRNFGGLLDEVRFFNKAKTQAEVQAGMNTTIDPNTTNLIAYYTFDGAVPGSTVADQASNLDAIPEGASGTLPQYSMDIPQIEKINFGSTTILSVTETGTTASFQVTLNQAPTQNVTIGVSSSDTGEGTVSPATLTFTPSNWNTPQAVTVTGVADNMIDGNQYFKIISAASVSGDANFNGIETDDINVLCVDVDGKQRSLCMNGTNEYLLIPAEVGDTLKHQFTIQFWAKRDNTDNRDYVVSQVGNATENSKLIIGYNAGTSFTFDFWGNRVSYDYTTEDNRWRHWACTYNGNTATLYLDGVSVGSANLGTYMGAGELWLGGDNAFGTYFFGGKLNDVRIYDKARTQGEIQGDMNSQITGGETNLVMYLPINNEDCLVDYSTNHYPIGIRGYTNNTPTLGIDYPCMTEVAPTTFPNNMPCTGFKFSPETVTVNEGSSATVNVQLTVAPTADVTVSFTSSNTTEVTVSPAAITFTSGNWNTPQSLTITGVETAAIAPDFVFDIITGAATSNDASYSGLNPVDIQVRKLENDCTMNSTEQDREAARQDYLANYAGSAWSYSELNWTGNADNCIPGTFSQTVQDKMLQRLNYYRRLAGCNNMLTASPGKNNWAQHAALIMQANNFLTHSVPNTAKCFTAEGGTGAAGNLAVHNQSANPIDMWMDDDNQDIPVGHRRWSIHTKASSLGQGMAGNYACQYIRSDNASNGYTNFIAYPAAGYQPRNLAYTEWIFTIPGANFSNADVRIYGPNGPISSEVRDKSTDFSGDASIVFRPVNNAINLSSTEDITYSVLISGVANAPQTNYCYQVIIFDPNTEATTPPDPNACDGDNVTVSSNPTNGDTTKASQTITTSGTVMVASGQSAVFQAGQSVSLMPGFHAQGTFSAIIDNCTAQSLSPNEPDYAVTNKVITTPIVQPVMEALNLTIAPNPFQYSTTIKYQLPKAGPVSMAVFNMQGRRVKELVSRAFHDAGLHQIKLQSDNLEGGIYFVVIQTTAGVKTQKMMLIR